MPPIEVVEVREFQFELSVRSVRMTLSESEAENLQKELEEALYPGESYEVLREKVTKLERKNDVLQKFIKDTWRPSWGERIETLFTSILTARNCSKK